MADPLDTNRDRKLRAKILRLLSWLPQPEPPKPKYVPRRPFAPPREPEKPRNSLCNRQL